MRSCVCVKSFGCSLNFADGEIMAGCLKEAGYEIVDEINRAKIVIYNTCAVKSPTENKIIDLIKRTPKDKVLIVSGCLPLINMERLKREVDFDGAIGPAPGSDIVKVIEEVEKGRKVVFLRNDSKPPLSLPRVVRSKIIRIVPIAYGCLGECAYCCVRFARGRLRSYSMSEILEEIDRALMEGAKEVWLTAQDSAAYGLDIGTDLASLLKNVVKREGEFFVRVGMMNPEHALKILDRLVEAYEDDKVFKFLHIPVQSGEDEILRIMNRRYSVEEFKEIVRAFRGQIPQVTIATDFICGFPGESEQAFKNSLSLMEEVKPDVINISKFFPRPNTVASKMGQLPSGVVKERSGRMTAVAARIMFEKNKEWIGWKGSILVDEVGKRDTMMGRNFAYKPIVIKGDESILGKSLSVIVSSAFSTYLGADIAN